MASEVAGGKAGVKNALLIESCPANDIYHWNISTRLEMETAKIFWSGRSQAVRLPKEFRFEGEEVRIRRRGRLVILEPIAEDWDWLDRLVGSVDEDFEKAASEEPRPQERPELDFFK
jgi:antitoxin VapB